MDAGKQKKSTVHGMNTILKSRTILFWWTIQNCKKGYYLDFYIISAIFKIEKFILVNIIMTDKIYLKGHGD